MFLEQEILNANNENDLVKTIESKLLCVILSFTTTVTYQKRSSQQFIKSPEMYPGKARKIK